MKYYVHKYQTEPGANHEVHKENCWYLPKEQSREYLGEFATSAEALEEARKRYPDADGCAHCCPEIHHE